MGNQSPALHRSSDSSCASPNLAVSSLSYSNLLLCCLAGLLGSSLFLSSSTSTSLSSPPTLLPYYLDRFYHSPSVAPAARTTTICTSCSAPQVQCSPPFRPGRTLSHKCRYHGDQYSSLSLTDCAANSGQSYETDSQLLPPSPHYRLPSHLQTHYELFSSISGHGTMDSGSYWLSWEPSHCASWNRLVLWQRSWSPLCWVPLLSFPLQDNSSSPLCPLRPTSSGFTQLGLLLTIRHLTCR